MSERLTTARYRNPKEDHRLIKNRLNASGEVFHTQLAEYEDVEEWGRKTPYIGTCINRVKFLCDVLMC